MLNCPEFVRVRVAWILSRIHGHGAWSVVAWWTSNATYLVVRFMSAGPCCAPRVLVDSMVAARGALSTCVRRLADHLIPMPEYIVVARAASGLYFPRDGYFRIRQVQSPHGPLDILFQTRRVHVDGVSEPIPKGLWAEIRGNAPSLRDALDLFPQVAQTFAAVLSVVANAPTEDLVAELAFESTAGDRERDFFQQFLFDERFLPFIRPKFPGQLARRVLELLGHHAEQDRIHRAMAQYYGALQHWAPGSEIMALGHLWMGMEAMTPVALRHYLANEKISREEVVERWGIELRQLDAEVRRRLPGE